MTTATCAHFWQIERANGPTSLGICRFCKARREFANYADMEFGKQYRRDAKQRQEHEALLAAAREQAGA